MHPRSKIAGGGGHIVFVRGIAHGLFDTLPIVAEIDARKLLFFGRQCRLSHNALTKSIFLTRLLSYIHDLSDNQLGFIPDVMKIIRSYGLVSYLWKFLEDGSFPEKPTWKKLVCKSVTLSHISQREIQMSHDNVFTPLSQIFAESKSSKIWDIPENYKEIELCNSSPSCVLAHEQQNSFKLAFSAIKCFLDAFQHSSCVCPTTAAIRDNWKYVITNLFDIRLQGCVSIVRQLDSPTAS